MTIGESCSARLPARKSNEGDVRLVLWKTVPTLCWHTLQTAFRAPFLGLGLVTHAPGVSGFALLRCIGEPKLYRQTERPTSHPLGYLFEVLVAWVQHYIMHLVCPNSFTFSTRLRCLDFFFFLLGHRPKCGLKLSASSFHGIGKGIDFSFFYSHWSYTFK